MQNITDQLKELSRSPDLYVESEKIGNKFNLLIDQVGELDAEIRNILSGFSKSTDFKKHIMERLEVDHSTADKITEEVNKEVFSTVRERLQKMQVEEPQISNTQADHTTQTDHGSNFEKAGGFSIEKEPVVPESTLTSNDRSRILASVEDPMARQSILAEPMPDQLLDSAHTEPAPEPEPVIQVAPLETSIPQAPVTPPPEEDSFPHVQGSRLANPPPPKPTFVPPPSPPRSSVVTPPSGGVPKRSDTYREPIQ